MLRRLGTEWSTTLSTGECIHFPGVFDREDRIEPDSTGKAVRYIVSNVYVETTVAKKFSDDQVLIDDESTRWIVREKLREQGGALTRCLLVEVPQ